MASEIMMALGEFRFGVSTAAYSRLTRRTDYRWKPAERHGRAPAMHYLGLGSDAITLDGTIYPHHAGGLGQIDTMRRIAGTGKPLILSDGEGRVWGDWVILHIEETRTVFDTGGRPLKQTFRLDLSYYGKDAQ